ncbi:outer-membrane lipoprotein LolB [Sideroxyarcus emersonii]|uniref:Outer-membrane lipoprotein LolB n=1 Tax=Sideroxyarcus emersonii TaxID=2764705 RepID=A0AAN1XBJ3_9PROT|nr:lipoprotein insertase outer membrane protein LolB [Sideroxyarcus emersonii]BCK88279.1 outer-membrane lipoprotein LolB [Sideroxyarcus emersonii]
MYRFLLLPILLLAGCATAPVAVHRQAQADAPFTFNGRVAVKQGEQRDSAGMRWVHRSDEDEILLLAPLGQTVARIHRGAGEATLDASGKHHAAQDVEGLMQQVLGWQLPLSDLRYWVTAVPAPDGEFDIERDANGQVKVLRQQGWEISYSRYAAMAADALPLRLKLQRDGVQVLLLIDEWEAQ